MIQGPRGPGPVMIGALGVRPIPPNLAVGCTQCRTDPAHWELAEPGQVADLMCCSRCFLYRHPLLLEQSEAVNALAHAVEARLGRQFPRDDDGRLTSQSDADRIVAGIVLGQRYVLAQQAQKQKTSK